MTVLNAPRLWRDYLETRADTRRPSLENCDHERVRSTKALSMLTVEYDCSTKTYSTLTEEYVGSSKACSTLTEEQVCSPNVFVTPTEEQFRHSP